MTWFKVDDSFWANPKVLRISAEAIALWVKAGAWSCQNLTDGHIDKAFTPIFGQPPTAAEELADAGLWEDHGTTWYFHDWDEYQETSEAVKKRREQSRERQRRARAAREDKRTDTAQSPHVTASVTRDITREFSTPDPTRPDPTIEEEANASSSRAPQAETPRRPKRGKRLPDDWKPSEQLRAAMDTECPHIDQWAQFVRFKDYWTAQPGQRGVKTDWDATYRNWIRRAADDAPRGRTTPTGQATGNQRAQQAIQAGLDLERMMSGDQADRAIAR